MFKNILVAVDIEDRVNAEHALKRASALAKLSGAMIHLLHVRYHLPTTYAGLLSSNFDAEERKESQEALERLRAGLDLNPDRITITTERGPVTNVVLGQADKWEADLIILGSHTPSTTSKIFGSNATSIVRDAKTSVLVVRANDISEI